MNRAMAMTAAFLMLISGVCRAADNELSDQEK
jgi:hypothetical protein